MFAILKEHYFCVLSTVFYKLKLHNKAIIFRRPQFSSSRKNFLHSIPPFSGNKIFPLLTAAWKSAKNIKCDHPSPIFKPIFNIYLFTEKEVSAFSCLIQSDIDFIFSFSRQEKKLGVYCTKSNNRDLEMTHQTLQLIISQRPLDSIIIFLRLLA